ncbi:MAG: YggS family pyridoxal phosphate-dependent enzyme [Desulfovibrio sp.]|nr:MAG: YggS family pyridoxal phosphate-dependent enzyme [Desulfovibrio sp.]
MSLGCDPSQLLDNLEQTRERVDRAVLRSGRRSEDVILVAISKRHDPEAVRILAGAGQRDFGESYVQEALAKQDELQGLDIAWHFIGGLQSNKAKFVPGRFDLLHSVGSAKLAAALNKAGTAQDTTMSVLMQVNLAREPQKSGVDETEALALAQAIHAMDHLRLQGLMVMPPYSPNPEDSRPLFSRLRELRGELLSGFGPDGPELRELSMGMSHDLEVAVEEGATFVRAGTCIFGERPPQKGTLG